MSMPKLSLSKIHFGCTVKVGIIQARIYIPFRDAEQSTSCNILPSNRVQFNGLNCNVQMCSAAVSGCSGACQACAIQQTTG